MYIPNLMMAMLLDENPFEKVAEPIVKLLNLAVTPQDREKAKNSLKNAIIGFVLIFVLIVVLKIGMDSMQVWMSDYVK